MKYIKVTKDNSSSVVLGSNEAFYKAQGYEISEPSKSEIENSFPEEREKPKAAESNSKKAAEEALKVEKAAHGETLKALELKQVELEETQAKLEEALKNLDLANIEIEKLSKA